MKYPRLSEKEVAALASELATARVLLERLNKSWTLFARYTHRLPPSMLSVFEATAADLADLRRLLGTPPTPETLIPKEVPLPVRAVLRVRFRTPHQERSRVFLREKLPRTDVPRKGGLQE